MQRLTEATNRAEREEKEEVVGRKKEEEEDQGAVNSFSLLKTFPMRPWCLRIAEAHRCNQQG